MKTKKSFGKIMMVIITIITLLFPNFSVAATTLAEEIRVKLVENREDNICYSIGDASSSSTNLSHKIWNMVKENDETASVYCMNAEKNGFDYTNSHTESDYASYNTEYDMKLQADKTAMLQNVFTGSEQTVGTNYSKILALFDLLYIPEDTENATTFKANLLQAAGVEVELTDASIKAIQQAAIWYFVNNSDDLYKSPYEISSDNDGFATWLYVKGTADEEYNAVTDYYEDGYARQEAFGKLYTYLINTAITNSSKYGDTVSHIQDVTITDTNAKLEEVGADYVYGPFSISKDNSFKYGLSLKVNDSTDYILLDENKEEVTDKSIDNFTGEQFYVKVSSANIDTVSVSVTANYTETLPKLYTSSSKETVLQPIAMLSRKTTPFNFTASQDRKKKFDLALRKYIIKKNGEDLEESRVPVIDKTNLSAKNGETTATYRHRKDPVIVEKNDVITYRLTIYNEGEKAGRATELIDQLPTGVEFTRVVEGNFELAQETDYNKTTNRVTLTRKPENSDNLQAYNEETKELKSEDIDIECKVIADATEDEKVLTNVAWISKEYNAEDNKIITTEVGEDRDSEPLTTPKANDEGTEEVTKDNIENYKGNPENSDILYNSNTFYKGWQDDDDFEKLVLNPASKYNLKITKTDQFFNTINTNIAKFKVNGEEYTATNGVMGVASNIQITSQNVNTPDTYEITEITAPEGYLLFRGTIILKVYKTTNYNSYGLDYDKIEEELIVLDEDGNEMEKSDYPVELDYDETTNSTTLNVKVQNKKESGLYEIRTKKVDENGELITKFSACIKIENNDESIEYYTVDGLQEFSHLKEISIDTLNTPDEYTITEVVAPENYEKFNGSIKLYVYKQRKDGKYCINKEETEAHVQVLDENGDLITGESPVKVEIDEENASIFITLKNELIPGKYNVNLIKEDEFGEQIDSKATFDVNGLSKEVTGRLEIAKDIEINRDNVNTPDVYVIKEIEAPDDYCEFDGTIILTVNKKIENFKYVVDNYNYIVKDRYGNDITAETAEKLDVHLNEDGNLYVEVKNYKFDLKLIKRIVEVNGEEQEERIKSIDASKLNTKDDNGNVITTADYKLEKNPVSVKPGDIVTYSLRVYNEGYVDGFAAEITEDIPEGLEFIATDDLTKLSDAEREAVEYNNQRGWKVLEKDENGRITFVKTTALSTKDNLLRAFGANDGTKTADDLDYREIKIKLKVIADNITKKIIRNEACISKDKDQYGEDVDDRDSTPEEWKKENSDKYNDDEKKWAIYKEDDEDYDNIVVEVYDLALRKFIAKVDDKELKDEKGNYTREPQVDTSKLNTVGEDGKIITTAIYNHPKSVVEVKKGDIITYILRVYNEGEVDGYATEIKDHLPEYLEFVEGDFNTKYKWTVSDDGRTVTSTYLSNQLIAKPRVNEEGKIVLSYKDVPIQCKVKTTAIRNQAITNIADITKCTDKYKKDVVDRDSETDNVKLPSDKELPSYKENEKGNYVPGQQDDDDFEKILVKDFDLALRKWVTESILIENGTKTVTTTGHDAWDDPEEVVKVELHRRKLDKVEVKFRYSIRVYNQGDIEGYAKEITDYIPEGLKFLPEDNEGWVDEGNNIISTRLLENTLLKPGDYADVEVVLTWINGKDNVGLKINTAEISEDYNDKGVPDIDSTPDNQKPGEDDIDDAPVMLSIETGRDIMYLGLVLVILITLASGIIIIKKKVL